MISSPWFTRFFSCFKRNPSRIESTSSDDTIPQSRHWKSCPFSIHTRGLLPVPSNILLAVFQSSKRLFQIKNSLLLLCLTLLLLSYRKTKLKIGHKKFVFTISGIFTCVDHINCWKNSNIFFGNHGIVPEWKTRVITNIFQTQNMLCSLLTHPELLNL